MYIEADPFNRKALEIRLRILGEGHVDTATSYFNLAFNLTSLSRYKEAETFYRKAISSFERALGKDHPTTIRAVERVANIIKNEHQK